MITSLKPNIDLTKEMLAYSMDQNVKTPSVGQKIKLYIPVIMANIPQEESNDYKIITKGSSIFKNSPNCQIQVNDVIEAQNYIEGECENNTNWDGADNIELSSSGNLKSRTLNEKTKLSASFTNGKFKAVTFNTCKYLSDSITSENYTSSYRYSGDVSMSNIKSMTGNIGMTEIEIDTTARASTIIRVPDEKSINKTITQLSRDMMTMQNTINTLLQRLQSTNVISTNQSKRWQ